MANESTRAEADAEINLSRLVDAPREVLFNVWTDAQHLAQWFGPKDVALPFCKVDPRPGGVLHLCHRLPDGTEVWVKGAYREVVAPERLVFTLSFVDPEGRPASHPMLPDWPLDAGFLTTVTFADVNGKTQLTVRQVVVPAAAAALDIVAREREGARTGWAQTLDRLEEYVSAQA
jgi:uncharacterized protein YndB with AHSA1/START domain